MLQFKLQVNKAGKVIQKNLHLKLNLKQAKAVS